MYVQQVAHTSLCCFGSGYRGFLLWLRFVDLDSYAGYSGHTSLHYLQAGGGQAHHRGSGAVY
jgi:hypothetical protein